MNRLPANRLPALIRQHLAGLRMLLVFTVLCGIGYPVAMWGVAQGAFRGQANGSLVTYHGRVAGSSLLCQEFSGPRGNPLPQYFQPRPSAANSGAPGDYGCDPGYSGAANLGPDSSVLRARIRQRQRQIAAFDGVPVAAIPPDAVTSSGSGLDPDISPQYAYIQVNRVAAARHLPVSEVRGLVTRFVQGRTLGFLGEPRVDVLTLNIALGKLPGQ